jgi:hypothetical protein
MRLHSESDFLAWAEQRGMGLDPQYPRSETLIFTPDPGFTRFWTLPPEPKRRPGFLHCMLEAFGPWSSYYCWKHLGNWPAKPEGQSLNDQIEHAIFKGIGLPEGSYDVVEFNSSERVELITLLLTTTIFGFTTWDDLFLVSDTAHGILQTDHHGTIHTSFRDEANMNEFIRSMEQKHYSLPDDLPDGN